MNIVNIDGSRYSASRVGWPPFIVIVFVSSICLFLAIFLGGGGSQNAVEARIGADDVFDVQFSYCAAGYRQDCVVDGDTFWFQGQKIRIADINTPEVGGAKCAFERRLGERAKGRLLALLNQGSFSLQNIDRDTDKYGRALRIVNRDGDSLGDVLVGEGLAEEWAGYRRDWC